MGLGCDLKYNTPALIRPAAMLEGRGVLQPDHKAI